MERELEKYIIRHCTPEDHLLEELYRQTYVKFINPNMVSGHLQGLMLEMISKMVHPCNILEIGTFTGYSAICLAKGLSEGGRLITIEINDEIAEFAYSYFEKAGFTPVIEQRTGNALDIIPSLDILFDLVFIDGDKREYIAYYKAVIDKVRPGGFILADNVLWGGKAIKNESVNPQTIGIMEFNEFISIQTGIENMLLPLRDGIMIIRKK